MVSLKNILSNKQARGAFGRAHGGDPARRTSRRRLRVPADPLERIRPDCCVKLPESQVRLVIDAKFPLEAFNALKSAAGEADIRACEARLRRDVIHHVRAIADKYLITGETHETAVMFVPSESVYADFMSASKT